MTAMCRDGFVTNQRYQNLKDSKHSACVLSTCYDEVFQVVDDEDEDLSNDGDDSDNSNFDGSKQNTKKSLQDSVVINMYNDSDEEM